MNLWNRFKYTSANIPIRRSGWLFGVILAACLIMAKSTIIILSLNLNTLAKINNL